MSLQACARLLPSIIRILKRIVRLECARSRKALRKATNTCWSSCMHPKEKPCRFCPLTVGGSLRRSTCACRYSSSAYETSGFQGNDDRRQLKPGRTAEKKKDKKGPPLEFRPRAPSSERKPRKSEAPQELAAALNEKRRTV